MHLFDQLDTQELSPIDQEIYRFIVHHIENMPYMRVREIAQQAHVSSTSVFRFIKKAGFDSFPEFRFFIKSYLTHRQTEDSLDLSLEAQINSLTIMDFHPDIDYQLQQIAQKMQDADLILFLGMGTSGAIAQYAARKLSSLGLPAIHLEDMTYPIHSLVRSDRQTIFFFFSVSGETKELLEFILNIPPNPFIQQYCITRQANSPLAKQCRYAITYQTTETRKNIFLDLTNQLPVIAIFETLTNYLISTN